MKRISHNQKTDESEGLDNEPSFTMSKGNFYSEARTIDPHLLKSDSGTEILILPLGENLTN